jgi:hypothetical protein
MTLVTKNSGFDLYYTLTPTQIADTVGQFPGGVFFLNNITDNINLGNNTIVQTDYGNVNVNITSGLKLDFVNRFIPSVSSTPKQLQIKFYVGYNSGNYDFAVSDIFLYNSRVLTAPYRKQNLQYNIIEKTTCFDYTYTLTDQQFADTKGQYPGGVFYLFESVMNKSLGNNTLVQNDYANINVNPVNKVLTFQNRVLPFTGVNQVNLRFWTGSQSVLIDNVEINAVVLPFESTYSFVTNAPSFNLTYTLSPYQIADTITRFPNGIYYLNDSTDNMNLGNGTNDNSDPNNINVSRTNTNQLVFLNRTPPSIGMKNLTVQFYVGYFDGNIGYPISENIQYEALAAANICFTGDTPITTDQGNIPISLIQPEIHTIHKKRIVAITKTIMDEDYMISFEKDSLYPEVPSQRTVMTRGHKVFYKGRFIAAKYLSDMGIKGVCKIENKNKNERVYNVLMEDSEVMMVNHLICETLHPQNKIAKLFTEGASLSEYSLYYEKLKNEVNAIHRVMCQS